MYILGNFRSVSEILLYDLTEEEEARLVNHIKKAVEDFQITDLTMLLPLLATNDSVRRAVLSSVKSFVTKELKMHIID